MGEFEGFDLANYTQVPNVFFDGLLSGIDTLAELKVILVVLRQTVGWHKPEDKISLTQLELATGMSRPSVVTGARRAEERGCILADKSGHITAFQPRLKVVKELNQSKDLTTNGKETLPIMVKTFNTQKKEIKKKEREEEEKEILFEDLQAHPQSIISQPEAPISQGFEPSVADPSKESPDVEELARQLAPPIDWVWDYDKATNKALIHAAKELLIRCKDGKIDDVLDALDEYLSANGAWARKNIDSPMGLITLVARQYQKMQGQAERQATARSAWAEDIEASQQAWAKRPQAEKRDPWWEGVLGELKLQMTKGTFDAWLKPTVLLEQTGRRIVVGVASEYAKDWLDKRLRGVIERAVVADGVTDVEFEIIGT